MKILKLSVQIAYFGGIRYGIFILSALQNFPEHCRPATTRFFAHNPSQAVRRGHTRPLLVSGIVDEWWRQRSEIGTFLDRWRAARAIA
jgi:hypothetical protein